MKKLLGVVLGIFLSILLIVAVLLSIVIFFQIPIDLTRFKEPLESAMTKALDRPVRIEKSAVISTSLKPYLTLEGFRIANPRGFAAPDFVSMDLAKIQLELLPLLAAKLHLSEVQVQGLHVTLEETADGRANWIFTPQGKAEKAKPMESEKAGRSPASWEPGELANDTLVVRNLNLQDISVDLYRPGGAEPGRYFLKQCSGAMVTGRPLHLNIDGIIQETPYKVDISVGSLEELLTKNISWMEMRAWVAETVVMFKGNVDLATVAKSLTVQATAEGANLSSLNTLLNLDLPPFTDFRLETGLHLQAGTYDLQKLRVKTGSSSLEGSAKIVHNATTTSIDLKLRSPVVQIDDFVFDGWSWTAADAEGRAERGKTEKKNRNLFAPEILAKFDTTLSLEADEVLSGDDLLGSGQMKATLKNGRITISSLDIQLPGGNIAMNASVKPGTRKSDADLKVNMKNFDIGILARRSKPDSRMGGLVNLDIDVQSSAATVAQLLANGNGYFDFSGTLENFGSGIIDLWAVNLVAAIVSSAEKERSMLNCAVGRWSVVDGLLQSDAFFMDTSRIRICAGGTVDLKEQRIDLGVKPRAKKAQFFSLATPLEVHGSFDDINFDLGGGGIVGTAVKFIASPVSVPLSRTFSDKIPADGRDVCTMPIGPTDRDKIKVPLCN